MGNSGWNRPAANQPTVKKGGVKAPSKVKGIVAGLVTVFALGILCLWMFSGGETRQDAVSAKGRGHIKAVTPAGTSKVAEVALRRHSSSAISTDSVRTPGADAVSISAGSEDKGMKPIDISTGKSRFEVFKHMSESHLAFLTCAPLGTMMIGDFDYNEDFIKDLKESLEEEIVINPDDEDDIRFYKESVIAVKKELKGMFDRGENVAKLLADTRKELQKLGVYKAQVEAEMTRIRNESGDMSLDDAADLVGAMNKMLEEHGIEPIQYSKLTGAVIRHKTFASPAEIDQVNAEVEEAEKAILNEQKTQSEDAQ